MGGFDSKPWLTIIMPTYRGEAWIDAALASIAAEAPEGVEVLVIDSSPDTLTLDIARTYVTRLQIRLFERPDLMMWHSKTNFGVEIAAADHICCLHQDDVWLPGRVANMRDWIAGAPYIPLHLAPSAIVDGKGAVLGVWRCPLPRNAELKPSLLIPRLVVQNFIAIPAPVFRRDAWLSINGLDEALWYTADWDLWLKLGSLGTIYHDQVTTGFRVHGGSLTVTGSRDIADFVGQMEIVLERYLPLVTKDAAQVAKVARASIAVNVALAAASNGDRSRLGAAALAVLRLGPVGMYQYFRDSRIVERVLPRVRAKLSGAF